MSFAACAVSLAVVASAVGGVPAVAAEGRAYEMVSPPDKSGNTIDPRLTIQSTEGGDAVAYSASGAFAGAATSINGGYYIARRSDQGWSVDPIDAPQGNRDVQIATPSLFLSDDLSWTVQFSTRALLPGAVEGGGNLYRRDNLTGARQLIASAGDKTLASELVPVSTRRLLGATGDLSHFAFMTTQQLHPDATPVTLNAYEVVDGSLRLINRADDGSVDPGGGELGSYSTDTRDSRPISADGRRVFFGAPYSAGDAAPLYMRLDGARTIPLSLSQRRGDDPAIPHQATFNGASADGSVVYFTSSDFLTDDDSGGLYRLDIETGQLTHVTPLRGDPGDFSAVIYKVLYVTRDGSTVFFVSPNNLAGAATSGPPNLYAYRDGELDYVGAFAGGPEAGGGPTIALSPNGRFLVFGSAGSFTGYDNTHPECRANLYFGNPDGTCTEVFLYDAWRKVVTCPSCAVENPAENRNSDLLPQLSSISGHVSRAVLDDGRVFYTSGEKLVPDDVNGRRDVYQWQDGTNTLISTGRSREDSLFAEASADGRDVFFLTSERLVGQDVDDEADLYDARQGGGLLSQNPVVPAARGCEGDGCQGTALPAPVLPTVGSLGLSGSGNETSSTLPRARRRGRVRASAKRAVRGTVFTLTVKTTSKGRIAVSGKYLRSARKVASKSSAYRLRVRLNDEGIGTLRRRGRLTVNAKVRFTSDVSQASTVVVRVTMARRR
ncbi:hypothetical protein [Conexibacter sp. CPCC 206217]|uniref:TolB family protein n=1 Tax=Conexibacter sp. CPCC 206217 TaxID=3064574 RepID=UPI00271EA60D|nr:hypothetical protein [Conexibacter sp. CPCC 206217]MDO8209888.1 hypothetical protein [Conexibacter sp. CPCC 206217]